MFRGSAESNNDNEEWEDIQAAHFLFIFKSNSNCHKINMNAQCTLYNVHGISCNIAQKHTSVQKESPPMTVKMSLNSPRVHCPIADGTRLWCSDCILSIEIITKCSTLQNLDTSFHKICNQVARRYRFPVVFGYTQ